MSAEMVKLIKQTRQAADMYVTELVKDPSEPFVISVTCRDQTEMERFSHRMNAIYPLVEYTATVREHEQTAL